MLVCAHDDIFALKDRRQIVARKEHTLTIRARARIEEDRALSVNPALKEQQLSVVRRMYNHDSDVKVVLLHLSVGALDHYGGRCRDYAQRCEIDAIENEAVVYLVVQDIVVLHVSPLRNGLGRRWLLSQGFRSQGETKQGNCPLRCAHLHSVADSDRHDKGALYDPAAGDRLKRWIKTSADHPRGLRLSFRAPLLSPSSYGFTYRCDTGKSRGQTPWHSP